MQSIISSLLLLVHCSCYAHIGKWAINMKETIVEHTLDMIMSWHCMYKIDVLENSVC